MPRILPSAPKPACRLRRRPVLGGADGLCDDLRISRRCRSEAGRGARAIIGDNGGASAWQVGGSGKLLARLVADDGYALRKRLMPLVELLNGQAGLPKVWTL